jgi:hypothetical protein
VSRTLRGWLTGLAVGLCILTAPSVSSALLVVQDTVTPGVGVFHHEFTITNNTVDDVAIVSIVDAPIGDPFIAGSLVVRAGFLGSYDSGLGFVDFLGDTQLFAVGTTTGGFEFDSAFAPTPGPPSRFAAFEALTVNGDLITGDVQSTAVQVPEPPPFLLLVLGVLSLWVARRLGDANPEARAHDATRAPVPGRRPDCALGGRGLGGKPQ